MDSLAGTERCFFVHDKSRIGRARALAVRGERQGEVIDVVAASRSGDGCVHAAHGLHDLRCSASMVADVLRARRILPDHLDVEIAFPSALPVDGPSAGVAMALASFSVLTGCVPDPLCAVTGELMRDGRVSAVGGIPAKLEAARDAGVRTVLLPRENISDVNRARGLLLIPLETLDDALETVFTLYKNRYKTHNCKIQHIQL